MCTHVCVGIIVLNVTCSYLKDYSCLIRYKFIQIKAEKNYTFDNVYQFFQIFKIYMYIRFS